MQYSPFTRSTLRGLQRPLLQGASSLANDSFHTASHGNAERHVHYTQSPRIPGDRRAWNLPTTNSVPTDTGMPYTYWAPSAPVATPGSPMRPRFLPLPPMTPPTPPAPPYELFTDPPPLPSPPPPPPSPPSASASSSASLLCWYASPCGVPLHSTSARHLREHLARFHSADVDLRAGRARTRCQWWTTRGPCGREVFCDMLPKHVAGVHLRHTGCACPRCGRALSRADALARHLALYCPCAPR